MLLRSSAAPDSAVTRILASLMLCLILVVPAVAIAQGDDDADDDSGLAVWDRRADALAAGDVEGFVDATGVDALPERWRGPARLATRQRIERHRDLAAVADALRGLPRSRLVGSLDEIAAIAAPALVVGGGADFPATFRRVVGRQGRLYGHAVGSDRFEVSGRFARAIDVEFDRSVRFRHARDLRAINPDRRRHQRADVQRAATDGPHAIA